MLPSYNMKILKYKNRDNDIDWVVEFPDLKGCSAVGSTQEEALEQAEVAKELWLEEYFEVHGKYPEAFITQASYSGKLLLRMPKTIHKQLALQAEDEGVSLNALCNAILAEGFSSKQTHITSNFSESKLEIDNNRWNPITSTSKKIIPMTA